MEKETNEKVEVVSRELADKLFQYFTLEIAVAQFERENKSTADVKPWEKPNPRLEEIMAFFANPVNPSQVLKRNRSYRDKLKETIEKKYYLEIFAEKDSYLFRSSRCDSYGNGIRSNIPIGYVLNEKMLGWPKGTEPMECFGSEARTTRSCHFYSYTIRKEEVWPRVNDLKLAREMAVEVVKTFKKMEYD